VKWGNLIEVRSTRNRFGHAPFGSHRYRKIRCRSFHGSGAYLGPGFWSIRQTHWSDGSAIVGGSRREKRKRREKKEKRSENGKKISVNTVTFPLTTEGSKGNPDLAKLQHYGTRSIRYRPVLVAEEGCALWGNTLTTASRMFDQTVDSKTKGWKDNKFMQNNDLYRSSLKNRAWRGPILPCPSPHWLYINGL